MERVWNRHASGYGRALTNNEHLASGFWSLASILLPALLPLLRNSTRSKNPPLLAGTDDWYGLLALDRNSLGCGSSSGSNGAPYPEPYPMVWIDRIDTALLQMTWKW